MENPDDNTVSSITPQLGRAKGVWRETLIVSSIIIGMQAIVVFFCFSGSGDFIPAVLYSLQSSYQPAITLFLIADAAALIVVVICESLSLAFRRQRPSSIIVRAGRVGFLLGAITLGISIVITNFSIWAVWVCRGSGVGAC